MGSGHIDAGTITCHYDGVHKPQTTIGDMTFIGSNATLVTPVEIASNGLVSAGSIITGNMGQDELAVSRAIQCNIAGWQRPQKEEE